MLSIWRWNGEHLYENFEKYNYYGCNAGSSDSYMFYFEAACSDRHACAAYLCVGSTLCIQTYRRIFLWGAGIYGGSCGSQLYIYLSIFSSGFYCDRLSAYIYCNADSIYFRKCIDDSDQDAGAGTVKGRKRENESQPSQSSVSRYPDTAYFHRGSSGGNYR